jgi:hypothetical protein
VKPVISVVMVDGGFRENLWPVDSWVNQTLPAAERELVWVDYTKRTPAEVKGLQGARCFALGRDDGPQILAYAFNEGIRRAKGSIIVLPDGDVACEPDLLETIAHELTEDPELVLYVLRLNQREADARPEQDLGYLRATCTLNHTFNYGGCTAVCREWLIKMNGYEQLPFFCGYHYNGGDNYIRFKNMGLKVRWHPTQRVYHAWHPIAPPSKWDTATEQERFIQRRAAAWEWMAYDGLDPSVDRLYDPSTPICSQWPSIVTERGVLTNAPSGSMAFAERIRCIFRNYGVFKGMLRLAGTALMRASRQ